jgi:8-oxo-dGTP pyrophosphatase MutT (NUDIX family)|tara:strand:- start:12543 stop:13184 length:642 start_codon:yes stop_codon:yes gene_type:complete
LITKLKNNLKNELPGINSWKRMAVKSEKDGILESESLEKYERILSKEKLASMKKAAVLLALFKKNNEWYFPLIKRPMHERNHPGQIALPGGAKEEDEKLNYTAIREAFEEVGIKTESVDIIGKLTPLPVPVSGYLIYPFIGILKKEPKWILNEDEVDELIITKVSELVNTDNYYSETWELHGNKVEVPHFRINDHVIWGATASVLSEFIDLIH